MTLGIGTALRKLRRSQAGNSMIEFAIVAPLLVFLLIGIIEIGRYTYYSILAANAARAGAAYASQNTSTAIDSGGIKNAVVADGQNLSNWTTNPGSVTSTPYCSTGGSALQSCDVSATPAPNEVYYVKVQVNGTFKSLMKYPGIAQQLPVSGSATMRVASQ